MTDEDKRRISFVLDYLGFSLPKVDLWNPTHKKKYTQVIKTLTQLKEAK